MYRLISGVHLHVHYGTTVHSCVRMTRLTHVSGPLVHGVNYAAEGGVTRTDSVSEAPSWRPYTDIEYATARQKLGVDSFWLEYRPKQLISKNVILIKN